MSPTPQSESQTSQPLSPNAWRPLKVYLVYRLILASALLGIYFLDLKRLPGVFDFELYLGTALAYWALSLISLLMIRFPDRAFNLKIFLVIGIDILTISILEHASGPSSNNMAILLLVAVAAGGILAEGKLATLFAALATLAILYKSIYAMFFTGLYKGQDLVQTGLMGVAFFLTSFFAQQLSSRLRESEALAEARANELASMEELNHHIIQRMRTGIVVIDSRDRVLLINEACWKMFGMPDMDAQTKLINISPELADRLVQWRKNALMTNKPFKASLSGPEVHTNFTSIETGEKSDVLIFVDDNTRMAQQAQQLKLASLGGLTASIAHEIRNPLGAISHAAQLLLESPDLNKGDLRLAEIIQQHCQRMNKVIENVLQLSRRKPAEPDLLNIVDWLEQFVEEFRATQSTPTRINLQCERDDLTFRIDPNQIHQVLSNLMINGLRYSEKQTGERDITLAVGLSMQTEQPYIDIIDKGPGIGEEHIEKIFEPFYTTDKTGTGLGLYIARELCEANRARLDYVPMSNGACFRITFSHPGRNLAV